VFIKDHRFYHLAIYKGQQYIFRLKDYLGKIPRTILDQYRFL